MSTPTTRPRGTRPAVGTADGAGAQAASWVGCEAALLVWDVKPGSRRTLLMVSLRSGSRHKQSPTPGLERRRPPQRGSSGPGDSRWFCPEARALRRATSATLLLTPALGLTLSACHRGGQRLRQAPRLLASECIASPPHSPPIRPCWRCGWRPPVAAAGPAADLAPESQ